MMSHYFPSLTCFCKNKLLRSFGEQALHLVTRRGRKDNREVEEEEEEVWFLCIASPQRGDLRLSGLRQCRAPVAGIEPATEGFHQISGQTRKKKKKNNNNNNYNITIVTITTKTITTMTKAIVKTNCNTSRNKNNNK
ncbi:hypothetical protein PoB_007559600 [Plakobranchus ocellatus]|uniref:Uncharacterized protein n=1 Tax=Plakobranchus ocellatus TaxID=259542 RepID=A0AAV4DZ40_9GAST|nr:hypothetical protein PoB_007559600 [Plakobranchus ocellatus]